MQKVAVSEFRANLVHFLKIVEKGEVITLTSRGNEVAKIVPPDDKSKNARSVLKKLSRTAIIGDIVSPIENEWEVLKWEVLVEPLMDEDLTLTGQIVRLL